MNDLTQARKLIRECQETQNPYLELGNCGISDLSELSELFKCVHLETLIISNRWIDETGLGQSINHGEKNKISSIPEEIANLTKIKKLIIGGFGDMWKISDIRALENLTGLQTLFLDGNQISDIRALENLTGLQTLILSYNNISDIRALEKLTGLQTLFLGGNQISDIRALENLTGLQYINLKNNQIKEIPSAIFRLNMEINMTEEKWYGLMLSGNPIESPPIEILKMGKEAVLRFFEQGEKQGWEKKYEGKILIVGQAGAGKTTLLRKLKNPKGEALPNTKSTLGVDVETLLLQHPEKSEVKMVANIWDFGGQEIQYNLHNCFITSEAFYILVADNRKEDTQWEYWFHIIELLVGDCTVLVVINNNNNNSSITNFNKTRCKEWFPNIKIIECEVDFRVKDHRWESLQKEINIYFAKLPLVDQEVPKLWVPLRKTLIEKKKVCNYISRNDFNQLEPRDLSEKDRKLALEYFAKIGIVTHFAEDENLSDIIFLNPVWITQGLYAAISSANDKSKKGQFTKKWIYQFWQEHDNKYKDFERDYLLRLMNKNNFDICYPLTDSEKYVIPFLLPDEKPANINWDNTDNIGFRIQYPFMPKGIMSRLTVQLYDLIEPNKETKEQLVWKDGVILNNGTCRAKVTCYYDAQSGLKFIDIKIFGTDVHAKQKLLQLIHNKIQEIHKKWFKRINCVEFVICNCEICKPADNPHYFLLSGDDGIEGFLKAGVPEIQCPKLKKLIHIDELIGPIYSQKEIENMKRPYNDRDRYSTHIENFNDIQGNNGKIDSAIIRDNENSVINKGGQPENGKPTGKTFWTKKIKIPTICTVIMAALALFIYFTGYDNFHSFLRSCSNETTGDTTKVYIDNTPKETLIEIVPETDEAVIQKEE